MSEDKRQDWLNMKRTLEQHLPVLERQIIEFAVDGEEERYQFFIKKAIEHQNTIAGINELLQRKAP